MKLQGKRLLFLGDSITEGHGVVHKENLFTRVIERETGAICQNYGIGGTRIARQTEASPNAAHDRDYCARYLEMDPRADAVIVFGGTNDFGHGDAPMGEMGDRTPYTYYGALHTLMAGLMTRYPSAVIALLTPLHRLNEDNPRGDGNKKADVGTLEQYVNALKEVARYYALPVLDLYATSGMQPKVPANREAYMPDGLHPNDAGHRVLADKIMGFLAAQ